MKCPKAVDRGLPARQDEHGRIGLLDDGRSPDRCAGAEIGAVMNPCIDAPAGMPDRTGFP
jgi:hypothetical protein